MMMRLSRANRGSKGRIVKIEGAKEFRKKLSVLGLIEGEELSVDDVSLLGSPIVVSTKSARIALRKEEADKVVIDVS